MTAYARGVTSLKKLGLYAALPVTLAFGVGLGGCGDDGAAPPDGGPPDASVNVHSLDDFLPEVPEPTGGAQAVFAGRITTENAATEIPAGPASTGLVGDLYLRNAKAHFVIQAPSRAVGVNPYGGTLVDAIALDESGAPIAPEQFGEMSIMYQAGRTCRVDTLEILRDGSGGGPAVIRGIGEGDVNDWINLPGMGIFPIPDEIDPNVEDAIDCAVTYTLDPDTSALGVAYTLYNGGARVHGPFALFTDAGGEVFTWAPALGYHAATLSSIESLTSPTPTFYDVIVGGGTATGLVPRPADPSQVSAGTSVLGVSLVLFGTDSLLSILGEEGWALDLATDDGITYASDVVVGANPNDVEVAYQARHPSPTALTPVTGEARWQIAGTPATGARVAVFHDADGGGTLDEEDPIVTFVDVAADGTWDASLAAGTYLVSASVTDVARSAASVITVAAAPLTVPSLSVPDPARFDYEVRDADTGDLIPARLTVVGVSAAPLDLRVDPPFDRRTGVVRMLHAAHGTSVAIAPGDPVDPPLDVPAGGPYRIFVSHGPEWTYASRRITPAAGDRETITFELRHAVDTTGYLATEFHQHAIGSPDSSVSYEDRLASLVTEGIEYFAATDHDFLSDYDPVIDAMGLRGVIDGEIGVESTPFAWGHFIAWPLNVDLANPSRGAVDWADGTLGNDLLPGELMDAERAAGARIVQVNHPRGGFQGYFDVVQLAFDFAGHVFHGTPGALPVEEQVLRQPEDTDLYADGYDALEVWNGWGPKDTNGDGWREMQNLDVVMRDWLNFLAFGRMLTPVGNSDTHKLEADPAGLPRSLVRVPDDTGAGLLAGVREDVIATLKGEGGAPVDVVVTNGPVVAVSTDGGATSAIGRTVAPVASGAPVTFTVHVQAPAWMALDTVEVFVNSTYDPTGDDDPTALAPWGCFTSRTALAANDPCTLADGGARPLVATVDPVHERREVLVTFTLAASDVAAANRAGARGQDAVVVVRASGQSAMFPLLFESTVGTTEVPALVDADDPDAVNAVFAGRARVVFPAAFTAPVRVDFDGGGWTSPF